MKPPPPTPHSIFSLFIANLWLILLSLACLPSSHGLLLDKAAPGCSEGGNSCDLTPLSLCACVWTKSLAKQFKEDLLGVVCLESIVWNGQNVRDYFHQVNLNKRGSVCVRAHALIYFPEQNLSGMWLMLLMFSPEAGVVCPSANERVCSQVNH